jgi:hypothetical protein
MKLRKPTIGEWVLKSVAICNFWAMAISGSGCHGIDFLGSSFSKDKHRIGQRLFRFFVFDGVGGECAMQVSESCNSLEQRQVGIEFRKWGQAGNRKGRKGKT